MSTASPVGAWIQLRARPPSSAPPSRTTTRRPSSPSATPQLRPARPPPMITTSAGMVIARKLPVPRRRCFAGARHGAKIAPMDNPALARMHCDGLRDLVADNPVHWKDEQALQRIRALCARASEVIDDRACRAYLSAIDDYASALCWKADGRGPAPALAPYVLRREIMR